jgi:predicted lipid-binding transport protein (Tim44 family)
MRGVPMRPRRVAFLVLVAAVLAAATALARPGGGGTYSGGGSGGGGSSGGGGGDGGAIFALIALAIDHPVIGIPLIIVFALVAWLRSRAAASQKAWQTSEAGVPHVAVQTAHARGVSRADLDQIRHVDPAFSNVLFEDFVYFLYHELQRARAHGTASLEAFLAPQLVASLREPQLGDVRGIVIGAMRILRFSGIQPAMLQIELEIEANYAEVDRQGVERRFYVVDRMGLTRARTAKSRPADRARTLDCPNCGASIEKLRGTRCEYCHEEVGGGRFDWNVQHLQSMRKEARGPLLTSNVEEVGTDLPTRVDPGLYTRLPGLRERDPAFDLAVLNQRIAHIFAELQRGWSGRDPSLIRPYVSDNLFQSMMYWIDLYVQQRCRNVNEGARILRIDPANVLSDATYDAITVRLFATGLDYTIGDDGKMLSGSRSKARTYSEYWTLIRGVTRKGESKGDQACPGCGAPLKITMVGNCEYCRVKVTAGEFDWVLSRIEQDEAYTG